MEPEIFDTLTRTLESTKTRRLAMSGLLGPGLAAVVCRFTTSDIAAKHKKKKKHKKKPNACAAAAGECIQEDNICNPFGSPCCDCLECLPDEDGLHHCEQTSTPL